MSIYRTLAFGHGRLALCRRYCVFIALAWLMCTAARTQQERSARDSKDESPSLQTRNGLPGETVQAFAQTPDGFLWIGTTEGLLRFDGANYVRYSHENTPAMREDSVFSLLATRDGHLWIGTDGGGLLELHDGAFRAYNSADGLTDIFIRALYEDRKGHLWVAADSGLFRKTGARFDRIDNRPGMPAGSFHGLYEDRQGRIWAGAGQLYAISNERAAPYTLGENDNRHRVKSVIETGDGSIWVGTVSGLYRLLPGSARFVPIRGVWGTVRTLREVVPGELWAGTIGQGIFRILYRSPGERISRMTAPSPLISNTVLSIFADSSGNIWIGTEVGFIHVTRSPVHLLLFPPAADSDFGTVTLDTDGSLWAASNQLVHVKGNLIQPVHLPGIGDSHVRNILRASDGALWAGTDGSGLFKVQSGKIQHLTTAAGLINNFIRVMMEARDGSLWVGTDTGVSHFTNGVFHNLNMENGLSHFSVRSIIEDRSGDVWIGTEHGVTHLRKEQPVHDAVTEALSHEKVWAEHADSDGGLWFGTRADGLYCFRNGSLAHYSTANGLASDSIFAILEDRHQHLWLSGPLGVMLLNRRELERQAQSSEQSIPVHFFPADADKKPIRFYGGTQPAGAITPDGEAWFPTNLGLWGVRPDEFDAPVLTHLNIAGIEVDGRPVSQNDPLTLAARQSRLEIHFAPVLLSSQEDLRFRYRLLGFDKEWTLSGTQQRSAAYTNLPPGEYTFTVESWQIDHPERVVRASVELVKKPYFYRAPWFIALCVILAGLLVAITYRLRMRQVHERFQAVLAERSRLAREMHDTLIQGCASVSAMLEAALSCGGNDAESSMHMIDYANTQIRTTMDEARQAVWNLRKNEQAPNDLSTCLIQMGERLGREYGVHVQFHFEGEPFAIGQQATHELMMVAREALFNAVLHGRPGQIVCDLKFSADELEMAIADDGKGFEVSAAPTEGHYGLQGVRERVNRLDGRVSIESIPGQGTKLSVSIPRKGLSPDPGASTALELSGHA